MTAPRGLRVVVRGSLSERFWPKVDRRGPNECWLWLAAIDNHGYGVIGRGARDEGVAKAYVVAYELLVGPIPDGMELDHYRINPGPRREPCSRACVNPAHLEPVTKIENLLRGEGVCAKNARKTECVHGHAYTPENTLHRTFITKAGNVCNGRRCRECTCASSRVHT